MRVPGFSAEVSLGRHRERYEAIANVALDGKGREVQPQRCIRQGNSIVCTQCSDGICWTNVIHIPTLF
jgi:hypothetical protein